MAKFIIVLCAVIATASAGPGLVGPLGGVPFAYAGALPYSSPLTYSASLAYTSPVAYGLASGGSSRVDIQRNYNLAPQFAVPFTAAFTSAAIQTPYNVAQFAAPQPSPVAFTAPLAKYASPVPVQFGAPELISAPLKYSAPLLSNFNYYGSPLPYAFSGQINALPYATPLSAAPGLPIAGQFAASPFQLAADPSTAQTTRMTAVQDENPENDSEEIPAKLVSKSPEPSDNQKFATPAPVDEPQLARDGSQSPVAPVMRSDNN